MVKRLVGLALALLLMGAFYIYALLREGEQNKGQEQWLVTEQEAPLAPMGGLASQDPKALAAALGIQAPLPADLASGQVADARHHLAYARLLTATDGTLTVWGVRPAHASPLIRPRGLAFETTGQTLHSYPLLKAEDGAHTYYYLATGAQGAFVIRAAQGQDAQALAGLLLYDPD